ncbi:hypothetical protein Hbl1158_10295 [Halobaculum sp. CBA1158]|uniref:hypothetical protein n=1 Tax=Halobaculum sp. CBA1158 TaxID=2904243 RepID=UPI001F1DC38F|nr:hypothetical protein [Halobaculum sp. CBA1158]UIO98924.1 hypothetical protein Hbl1158_10295 [Halobaculum sp. CBA1158]
MSADDEEQIDADELVDELKGATGRIEYVGTPQSERYADVATAAGDLIDALERLQIADVTTSRARTINEQINSIRGLETWAEESEQKTIDAAQGDDDE